MAKKKLGSVKNTDEVVITSCNLSSDVTGTLAVTSGGTGQTTYTNGQLLIGNTTGNTLTKATLTQGSNMAITNGTGSITVATSMTPTFDRVIQTLDDSTSSSSGTLSGYSATHSISSTSYTGGLVDGCHITVKNNRNVSSGAITELCGVYISVDNQHASASTTSMVGVHSTIELSAGTNTSAYAFRADSAGSPTSYFGIYVANPSGSPTNARGIVSDISSGTNKWNIYISGTANNAIAGKLSIGSLSAPSNELEVTGNATVSGTLTVAGSAVVKAGTATSSGLTVSTTDRILGRSSAGSGAIEEITCTSFARSILDDADAATVRTTIGAGTGNGDVTGQSSSVDSEIALFSGTGGKTIKRATTTGVLKASSGVIAAATAGTDYVAPGSITSDGITMSTARLLGRTTASSGAIEEISVGTGLTLSSGSLTPQTVCTSGTANTSTGVTEHAWTSIPSGTKVILIAVSGLSTSGTSQLIVQLGDSGGYETTGYSGTVETGTGRAAHNQGFYMSTTTVATFAMHGLLTLTLLDSSTNLWSISGNLSADASTNAVYAMGGSKALSGTLDRVRITTVGGTDTIDGSSKTNITYFG